MVKFGRVFMNKNYYSFEHDDGDDAGVRVLYYKHSADSVGSFVGWTSKPGPYVLGNPRFTINTF